MDETEEFHKSWISIVQGNQPVCQDDAVKLAALQYQAYFLDRTAVHSVVGFCRSGGKEGGREGGSFYCNSCGSLMAMQLVGFGAVHVHVHTSLCQEIMLEVHLQTFTWGFC